MQIKDAEITLKIQRDVIKENNYLLNTPEQFTRTLQEQVQFIHDVLHSDTDTMIVSEYNGEVVGFLLFKASPLKKMSHTGTFGVMLHEDYRNIGIGRKLVEYLIEWAASNPKIDKVSLAVLSSND